MKVSSLLILEPPYAMARRLHDLPPQLGAVALVDAVLTRPSTNEVKGQMDLTPWCPLCIISDAGSGMRSTRRLPRTCVVFGLEEDGGASSILRAVASRPRPTPSDMVEWILKRTRLPVLGRSLSDLFSRPELRRSEASFLPFSVREHLRQLGDWGAVEWQRAAALADLASDRTLLNRTLSSEDTSAVEMRRWIQDLLGMSEREFHHRFGWEWVLEASLRRSGWVESSARGVRLLHPAHALVPGGNDWARADGGNAFEQRRATA